MEMLIWMVTTEWNKLLAATSSAPPAPPRVPPPRAVVFDPLRFKRVWWTSNSTLVLIGPHPTSYIGTSLPQFQPSQCKGNISKSNQLFDIESYTMLICLEVAARVVVRGAGG